MASGNHSATPLGNVASFAVFRAMAKVDCPWEVRLSLGFRSILVVTTLHACYGSFQYLRDQPPSPGA
jgi:hypothetical protein